MNPTFMITFGVKYRDRPHPSGRHANPDGYVTITAADVPAAMQMANYLYEREWAFCYEEGNFDTSKYPLGELEHFVAGQEPDAPEPIMVTENGRVLVLPELDAMRPDVARAMADAILRAADQAEAATADAAAADRRLADVEVKKHDDMF